MPKRRLTTRSSYSAAELPDEELIRIWAEEIDHNRVPVGLEGQLLLDELVRRKLFEQAEAARKRVL